MGPRWFELFWIPLVPLNKKQIWICGTCRAFAVVWRQKNEKLIFLVRLGNEGWRWA